MLIHNYILHDDLVSKMHSGRSNFITLSDTRGVTAISVEFIRFEERKEKYSWVHPDEIYFVISADHYVKALINCGEKMKWMTRHNTLKELLTILPAENFIRLNKFYLLNLNNFSRINKSQKRLYFKNDFSLAIPHRISPFLGHLLKSTYT
ncbi:MAG: LytTR family transcriptional regulator DNA-binding domain-containing protein [Ginsengibacter sp.]